MVRTLPLRIAVGAITLRAVPLWNSPIESTAGESGATSRLITVCTWATKYAPAASASIARCGCAPWPVRPFSVRSKASAEAITASGW